MRLRLASLGATMVCGVLLINCAASVGRPPASKARILAETPSGIDLHDSPHLRFGVPADADPRDDYLIDRGAYVASYNTKLGVANWVAWRLTAADLGAVKRGDDFRADERLPPDFFRVLSTDYQGAGYDRGHLCPSAHRTHDVSTNSTTFLMTNMIPQVRALNAGPWKGIETYERELVAKQGQDVYVVAGGIFRSNPKTIGRGVAVPAASYRVTIVVRPGQGPSDVTNATPVLAVEMPNDTSAKGRHWTEFRVSVDEVERDTGYDYLSGLPDEMEAGLEARAAAGRPASVAGPAGPNVRSRGFRTFSR